MKLKLVASLTSALLILGIGIQPADAEPTYKTEKHTIWGWPSGKHSLTSSQKRWLKELATFHENYLSKVTCVSTYAKLTSKNQRLLFKARAKNVCDYLGGLEPQIRVSHVSRLGTQRFNAGNVEVTFFLYPNATDATTEQLIKRSSTPKNLQANFGLEQQASHQVCQISSTGYGWNSAGFPIEMRFGGREKIIPLRSNGVVKALIVPVDFPNYVGKSDPKKYVENIIAKTNEYYSQMSYGKVRFDFTVLNSYVRMSKNAEDYGISTHGVGNHEPYYKEALTRAAELFDISGFDAAYVIAGPETPKKAITAGPAFNLPIVTADGPIPLGSATGQMSDGESGFRWLVHETGHLFGWVDAYDTTGQDRPGEPLHSRFGWWDIMSGSWDLFNLDVNGWFRYQVNWLTDESVLCFEDSKISSFGVGVENLASKTGTRLLVIKISDSKVLVIERKSIAQFSPMLGNPALEGILIYEVDSAKNPAMAPLTIIHKDKMPKDGTLRLAALRPGESAKYGNLLIEVTGANATSSFVKLTRVG